MNKEPKKPKQPKTIRWAELYDRLKLASKKRGLTVSGYARMAVSIQLDKDGV
jgi:hypothetical protein